MDWYKTWFGSPFYKILYQNRDKFEAQEFVENLLAYLQPRTGCAMLDIACGEGRFARQLAEHGFDVTGIDISIESIDTALTFESNNLHFFTQDMRFPFYINYFDYAFNFFTSFGYFSHDRDHLLAAKSFAASLKKNGILVIDYLNFEYVIDNLVAAETVVRDGIRFGITRKLERKHIVKEISFTDTENNPRKYTESVAAFTLSDFIRMFKQADMSLVSTFGDYRLGPYHPVDSPRLIMVFKRNMLSEIRDQIVQWDHMAWYYINVEWHNAFFDVVMCYMRNPIFWAPLYMFAGIFIPAKYKRNGFFWCLGFIITFALADQVSASLLKPHFHRFRPCHNPNLKEMVHLLLAECGGEYGFPSVHATNHFALGIFSAVTLSKSVKWIWPAAIFWAFIVCYAQIYVGVHFPLDVTFGACVGTIIGILTGKMFNRFFPLKTTPAKPGTTWPIDDRAPSQI